MSQASTTGPVTLLSFSPPPTHKCAQPSSSFTGKDAQAGSVSSAHRTDKNRCQKGNHRIPTSRAGPSPSDRIPSLRTCCGRPELASPELPACNSPPNGPTVPGFLLPLTFPSAAARDDRTTTVTLSLAKTSPIVTFSLHFLPSLK